MKKLASPPPARVPAPRPTQPERGGDRHQRRRSDLCGLEGRKGRVETEAWRRRRRLHEPGAAHRVAARRGRRPRARLLLQDGRQEGGLRGPQRVDGPEGPLAVHLRRLLREGRRPIFGEGPRLDSMESVLYKGARRQTRQTARDVWAVGCWAVSRTYLCSRDSPDPRAGGAGNEVTHRRPRA